MSSSSQPLVEATDSSDASTPSTPESPLRQTLGILRLAWPAVVGNLLYSTVATVDIKIVGGHGGDGRPRAGEPHSSYSLLWHRTTSIEFISLNSSSVAMTIRDQGGKSNLTLHENVDLSEEARPSPGVQNG
jgi:hypothetical protein